MTGEDRMTVRDVRDLLAVARRLRALGDASAACLEAIALEMIEDLCKRNGVPL